MKTNHLVPVTGSPVPVDEIFKVDEEQALRVHQRLCALEMSIRSAHFEVAELLWQVNRDRLYRKIGRGYDTLAEYVSDEFGMSERRGRYFVEIWEYYGVRWRECPEMLAGVRQLGWSVAKELVGVVTPANYREWYEKAEAVGVVTIRAAKRAALKERVDRGDLASLPGRVLDEPVGGPQEMVSADGCNPAVADAPVAKASTVRRRKPKMAEVSDILPTPLEVPKESAVVAEMKKSEEWTTKVLRFHKDSLVTVDKAIEVAKDQSGGRIKDSAFALDMICLSYLASVAADDVDLQREDLLRAVERLTGLTVIAVDEREGAIVYGAESADRLGGKESA